MKLYYFSRMNSFYCVIYIIPMSYTSSWMHTKLITKGINALYGGACHTPGVVKISTKCLKNCRKNVPIIEKL
jgi:hypothetical protein